MAAVDVFSAGQKIVRPRGNNFKFSCWIYWIKFIVSYLLNHLKFVLLLWHVFVHQENCVSIENGTRLG